MDIVAGFEFYERFRNYEYVVMSLVVEGLY